MTFLCGEGGENDTRIDLLGSDPERDHATTWRSPSCEVHEVCGRSANSSGRRDHANLVKLLFIGRPSMEGKGGQGRNALLPVPNRAHFDACLDDSSSVDSIPPCLTVGFLICWIHASLCMSLCTSCGCQPESYPAASSIHRTDYSACIQCRIA
jgi:hypothetical protein